MFLSIFVKRIKILCRAVARRITLEKIKRTLTRLTRESVYLQGNEFLVFTCVRNERLRMPFFLDYYRSRGVTKFFFVDNASSDGTREFLLSQKDTYVFWTKESYSANYYGVFWIEALLELYGVGHWCLLVDADEFLVYPGWEEISISELCGFLESERKTALKTMLLDMYAIGFPSIDKKQAQPLWEIFPYFDKDSHYARSLNKDSRDFHGGVRERVFGTPVFLQKIPLIKYAKSMGFVAAAHSISNVDLSALEGVLLHFKFDSLFSERVHEEASREEHWDDAREYKLYAKRFDEDIGINLYDPGHSVRFKDSHQLIELGLMKTSHAFKSRAFRARAKTENSKCL